MKYLHHAMRHCFWMISIPAYLLLSGCAMSPQGQSLDFVKLLSLEPHPEGGYYKQTYKSEEQYTQAMLPARYKGPRSTSTAIEFLLNKGDYSTFHRLQSDELWHFYAGGPLKLYVLMPDGQLIIHLLGNDPHQGQVFQALAPRGSWFAAEPAVGSEYSLVGCTVSPGFDFEDFEIGSRSALLAAFPQHAEIITHLTRKP